MQRLINHIILLGLLVGCLQGVYAAQYSLDESGDTLIGEIINIKADPEDTLLDIARRYGFGYQDIKLVNPDVDTWLPLAGQDITLPAQFILPVAPMEGIVLNIPEMRLYYYLPRSKGKPQAVLTYPLGIGREGWNTPYIKTSIIEKKVNPNWYPPESIRKEHAAAGDPLPRVVKAGPDNPLGDFAMRLGHPAYLIHGTNKPYGIGMRVSHGCIRLYPENIKALFAEVPLKTRVNIINQPYKMGVKNNIIYLEAHPFLIEDAEKYENNLTSVVALMIVLSNGKEYELDWSAAYEAIKKPTGLPIAIGHYLPVTQKPVASSFNNVSYQAVRPDLASAIKAELNVAD